AGEGEGRAARRGLIRMPFCGSGPCPTRSIQRASRLALRSPARRILLRPEIGFHRPGELDREWIAIAVARVAGGDADPAPADAVFLNVGLLDALEAHADVTCQHVGVVIGTVGISREAVWRAVGHRETFRSGTMGVRKLIHSTRGR